GPTRRNQPSPAETHSAPAPRSSRSRVGLIGGLTPIHLERFQPVAQESNEGLEVRGFLVRPMCGFIDILLDGDKGVAAICAREEVEGDAARLGPTGGNMGLASFNDFRQPSRL